MCACSIPTSATPPVAPAGASRSTAPARLALRDATAPRQAPSTPLPLDDLQVRFGTDPAGGHYIVFVRTADAAEGRPFEVANWVSAVAFRSHLQQLQRGCEAPLHAG